MKKKIEMQKDFKNGQEITDKKTQKQSRWKPTEYQICPTDWEKLEVYLGREPRKV